LDLLGIHFALINDQNSNLENDKLSAVVIREANIIKNEAYADMINHNTVSQFHNKNTIPQNQLLLFLPLVFHWLKNFKKLNKIK